MDREQSVQHFLDLIKRSQRGKFKVYIGMIAGVGKSYRMLQEAHELLENGVDVKNWLYRNSWTCRDRGVTARAPCHSASQNLL